MSTTLKSRLNPPRTLGIANLAALLFLIAAPVAAQTAIRVAPFRSVELHSGGEVILRHGPTQRVTLLKGDADCAKVKTDDAGRLVIEKYSAECHRKYDLQVEVVAPYFAELAVNDGGRINSIGDFPRQPEIRAAVRNGGSLDLRSLTADRVSASVAEGGRILVIPQTILTASVANGGQITYWGDPRVEKSIQHGGAVNKGTAADLNEPLSEADTCVSERSTPAVTSGRRRSWIF
jgi:Putative auto-transporter adhesin, head GIN domain